MKRITIDNISGSFPFDVYVADYKGDNRIFLANITEPTSFSIDEEQFQTMNEIMIIMSGSDGCEKFEIVPCGLL